MSRSYRKILTYDGDRELNNEKGFRVRNRICVHRELTNPDYGEVVFPSHICFTYTSRYGQYNTKNKTRKDFFLEIRHILNGHTERYGHQWDESFLDAVKAIKEGIKPERGWRFWFEWLECKTVKQTIKAWSGEPFDLLMHLAHRGYIEQAVCQKFKIDMAK